MTDASVPRPQHRNTNTLVMGILVILWITAVFIIVVLNNIKTELQALNRSQTSALQNSYMQSPGQFQIVDAKDGTTVLYSIEPKPQPVMDEAMMDPTAATQPAVVE